MRKILFIIPFFLWTCGGGGGGGSSPTEPVDPLPPTGVTIISVEYNLSEMTISWSASTNANFSRYNLYHSPTQTGEKELIYYTSDKSVTEYKTSDFNPGLYNWFFIEVVNTEGLKTMSIGKSNTKDSNPIQINFNDISWNGNQLIFSWNRSSDSDFKSYTIYSAGNEAMYDKSPIWTSTNIDELSYYFSTDCGSSYYYTIEVEDIWGLKTEGNILEGDSFYLTNNVFSVASGGTHTPGDIFEANDGGIVIIGKVSGSYGIFFQRLDQYGNKELGQTYGDGFIYGNASETDDGGYIISAIERISGSDRQDYLIKIDSNGSIEWSKSYGPINATQEFLHVVQTSDGGYFLASYESYTDDEFYVYKLDNNGEIQWEHKSDGGEMTLAGAPELIYEDDNGFYVVVITPSTKGIGSSIGDVLKYDSSGNLVSHAGAPAGGLRYTGETIRAHDSGYILGGDGKTKISILKADENMNLDWYVNYMTGDGTDEYKGFGIYKTNDDGFIFTGKQRDTPGSPNRDIFLIKTDSQGSQEWIQTYDISNNDAGHAVKQTSNGDYIIAGAIGSQLYFMRVDSIGRIKQYCN